jgi:hypothetical protein
MNTTGTVMWHIAGFTMLPVFADKSTSVASSGVDTSVSFEDTFGDVAEFTIPGGELPPGTIMHTNVLQQIPDPPLGMTYKNNVIMKLSFEPDSAKEFIKQVACSWSEADKPPENASSTSSRRYFPNPHVLWVLKRVRTPLYRGPFGDLLRKDHTIVINIFQ